MEKNGAITEKTPDVEQCLPKGKTAGVPAEERLADLDNDPTKRLAKQAAERLKPAK